MDFPHGTSTQRMANVLAQKGVVQDPWLFLAARAFERGTHLQAGEYRFEKPASRSRFIAGLRAATSSTWNCWCPRATTCSILRQRSQSWAPSVLAAFLAAARNPAMIRDLDPAAESLEGYLFPSKYRVYRRTTAQQICRHDDRRIPKPVESSQDRRRTFMTPSRSPLWWNARRGCRRNGPTWRPSSPTGFACE